MRLIDEKGKLFGLINVIDLLVVLMIVVVATGVLYKTTISAKDTVVKDMEISIRLQNVYPTLLDSMKIGDQLVAANGYIDATIANIEATPAAYVVTLPDGSVSLSTHPFRKDVMVTLKARAAVVGPNISLGGQDLKIEKQFIVKTKMIEAAGFISKLDVK